MPKEYIQSSILVLVTLSQYVIHPMKLCNTHIPHEGHTFFSVFHNAKDLVTGVDVAKGGKMGQEASWKCSSNWLLCIYTLI
jgi:hypothetical protein